jgi:phosphate starvation-inducible protein PhoH and related proteins
VAQTEQTLDVSNDVAAELASIGDGVLDALRDRLECTILLRGNRLTIAGDGTHVAEARAVVDELVELVEAGQEIGPATVDAVLNAIDQAENVQDVFGDVVWRHRGKLITPKTVTQKRYVEAIRNCTVTFGIGPAGTGKTYLGMAAAVAALQERQVARVILTRPAVEAGERLGFLPGDLKDKVDPYMRPLYDALQDMLPEGKLQQRIDAGQIEIAPLAYMRGRTLSSACVILDEAQNTTPSQMKMFLTRMGENSRMIVTGDPTQTDLPPGMPSGLSDAVRKLGGLAAVSVVRFDNKDVVRHPLVGAIIEAYEMAARQTVQPHEESLPPLSGAADVSEHGQRQ